jgi:hypothetical protein
LEASGSTKTTGGSAGPVTPVYCPQVLVEHDPDDQLDELSGKWVKNPSIYREIQGIGLRKLVEM